MTRSYTPGRLNEVVLLTDGKNDDPGSITQQALLTKLREEYDPAKPVRLITIAFGTQADTDALRQISAATHARSYESRDPQRHPRRLHQRADRVTDRGPGDLIYRDGPLAHFILTGTTPLKNRRRDPHPGDRDKPESVDPVALGERDDEHGHEPARTPRRNVGSTHRRLAAPRASARYSGNHTSTVRIPEA